VAQRLLWMIRHYRADFGALSCPLLCRLDGPLDREALGRALDALTDRHEALRTTFTGRGARLTQVIHDPRALPIASTDLSGEPDPEAALRAAIRAELAVPVDPQEWPLRAQLWRLGDDAHVLCLTIHHLVTDAWSTGILLRDLSALYGLAAAGEPPPPPPGWPYARFTAWQQELLDGGGLRRQQEYWRRQLTGTQLPALRAALAPSGPSAGEAAPGVARLDLDPALVAALRELARSRQTTLFAVLLAGFLGYLREVTGQDDLAVASMFANRSRPELRETVGLLANMVLLRAGTASGADFGARVGAAHAALIGAFAHQEMPFQLLPLDVVQAVGARPDDVMFQVMAQVQHERTAAGVRFELLVPDDIGSRFPFELALTPIGSDRIRAVLFHAAGWCDAVTAAGFLDGYARTLSQGAMVSRI
jgi:Condensation domain